MASKNVLPVRQSSVGKCAICGEPITDVHPDEVRMIPKGPVHDDCYFGALGDEIEKNPIVNPARTS